MTLDLSSLKKAVNSLERAINVANSMIDDNVDTDHEEVIRAGVIQNFEFTYELCWKFMRRWLNENVPGEIIDGVTMKELFRIAAEHHLIKDVAVWFDYHRARNETSHIYDEKKAESVYAAAGSFAAEAKKFLKVLETKND